MPGVHLYGKGRAGDGLISATWVMGTELALVAVASHRLQLRHATPFGGYDGAASVALDDYSRLGTTLFFHSVVSS